MDARPTLDAFVDVFVAFVAGVAHGTLALVVAARQLDAGTAVGARHHGARADGLSALGADVARLAAASVSAAFLVVTSAAIGTGIGVASALTRLAVATSVAGRALASDLARVTGRAFAT